MGGQVCLTGLGIRGNYDIFLEETIFRKGSLNLLSTEHTFRYREIELFFFFEFKMI